MGLSSIVGGSEAVPLQYNFAARLYGFDPQYYYSRGFCTASLISERSVLSAAHCCFNTTAMWVGVGKHSSLNTDTDPPCSEVIPAEGYTNHPSYVDGTAAYDVCVVRLQRAPSCFGGEVRAVQLDGGQLWPDEAVSAGGQAAVVVGWGMTSTTSSAQAEYLMQADHFLYDRLTCLQHIPYTVLQAEQACAGRLDRPDSTITICSGDSGGPIFVTQQGTYVQVGLSSYVIEQSGVVCTGSPGGFERTFFHMEWLQSAAPDATWYLAPPVPPSQPPPPPRGVDVWTAVRVAAIAAQAVALVAIAILLTRACNRTAVAKGDPSLPTLGNLAV